MPTSSPRAALMFALVLLSAGLSTGCKAANAGFWGLMGYEKRDLLVSDVKEARDDQNAAKEEIKTAMQRFKEVTSFQGGDLEAKYDKLNSAYERANGRAAAVTKRIADVEYSAKGLFDQWEKELGEYADPNLKQQSQAELSQTRSRYQQMLSAMRTAEGKMKPVLQVFHDRVLRLKHSLNAAAIASLQGEVGTIEQNVSALIADMEKSIAEANEFIAKIDQK